MGDVIVSERAIIYEADLRPHYNHDNAGLWTHCVLRHRLAVLKPRDMAAIFSIFFPAGDAYKMAGLFFLYHVLIDLDFMDHLRNISA